MSASRETAEKPVRVLVCGGRDYEDADTVAFTLGALHRGVGVACIIEGGAPGADSLARSWAITNGVTVDQYEAQWRQHGHAAGPMRNAQMLREGKPDFVVAFPGGKGTADMIRKAKAAGLTVITITGSVHGQPSVSVSSAPAGRTPE